MPLKAGAMAPVYGHRGVRWEGPSSMRVAWRVYSYEESFVGSIGAPCRTTQSQGQGTIGYEAGLNTDAGRNRAKYLQNSGRIAWPLVPNRDGKIVALSFLVRSTGGTVSVPIEIYKSSGFNSPGVKVQSRLLHVDGFSTWRHIDIDPIELGWAETYYVALATGSKGVSIEAEFGHQVLPHVMAPSSTNWVQSTTPMRPAMRVHFEVAAAENLWDSTNLSAPGAADTIYMLREKAKSDLWVSGFSFRMRATGQNQLIPFELRLSDPTTGRPRMTAARSGQATVSTKVDWYEVAFEPVFVPKDAYYFVGYKSPPASTGQLFVNPSSVSSGSSHYSKGPQQTSWSALGTSPQHAYRVYSACHQRNPLPRLSFNWSWGGNTEHAIRDVAPRDMWVSGFSLLGRSTINNLQMQGRFYSDQGGQPGTLLRATYFAMEYQPGWQRVQFDWPVFLRKGQAFHLALVTPYGQNAAQWELTSGANSFPVHGRSGTSSGPWQSKSAAPFAFKLHGGMGAAYLHTSRDLDVGDTIEMELSGATPLRFCGAVLGFSGTKWGPVQLPLELPPWPGCSLQVSYEMLLALSAIDSRGSARISLPVPKDPFLIGKSLYLQFWTLESSTSPGELSWSNGVHVRLGG